MLGMRCPILLKMVTRDLRAGKAYLEIGSSCCCGIMTLEGDLQRAKSFTVRDVPADVLSDIMRHCCGSNVHALAALTRVNRTFKDAVMQVRRNREEPLCCLTLADERHSDHSVHRAGVGCLGGCSHEQCR